MITDTLENLENYLSVFPQLEVLTNYLKYNNLENVKENKVIGDITLIPLISEKNDNFDPELLEAHRKLMDVHITLKGVDRIAYQQLDDKINIIKEYDNEHDYLLGKGDNILSLDAPEGYFCIIPNHFAHMALYNVESGIEKIVVKVPV
ncbi:MAG: YhcH/YjgK/YiaL family protein [Polaribacter sp.]|jgi:YhcH/YjgK/YiaL family protein